MVGGLFAMCPTGNIGHTLAMSPDEEMPSLQSFTPRMFSRPRDEGATPEAVSMQVRILDHQDNAAGIIRLREWALTKASPHEGTSSTTSAAVPGRCAHGSLGSSDQPGR